MDAVTLALAKKYTDKVAGGASGGGTTDHSRLSNRDMAGQHPISAITGLEALLAKKSDDPYADYTLLTGTAENPIDFNTITTPGFYKFTIDAAADSNFVNFPDMLWGFCTMEVKRTENVHDVVTGTLYTHIVQYADWNSTEGQRREAREGESWSEWDYSAPIYNDTPANSVELGGIMADPAEATDTQPVRIGDDNKLYTSPGGKSVLYTAQSLTDAQKEQARTNIGAEKVLTSETWTFTLNDGTTVTKEVYVK